MSEFALIGINGILFAVAGTILLRYSAPTPAPREEPSSSTPVRGGHESPPRAPSKLSKFGEILKQDTGTDAETEGLHRTRAGVAGDVPGGTRCYKSPDQGFLAEVVTLNRLETKRLMFFSRNVKQGTPSQQLRWSEVLQNWKTTSFTNFFTHVIVSEAFEDFFFEAPPVAKGRLEEPFECVLMDAGGVLERRQASSASFAKHLSQHAGSMKVTEFESLGGDAVLVVPCQAPSVGKDVYNHLGSFLRLGPQEQVQNFWYLASDAITRKTDNLGTGTPLWISTDGRGVPWLHLRLDEAPKYFKHSEYKRYRP
jgi:hypothetical protein